MKPREQAVQRSGGRCEAMVLVNDHWARCFTSPIEVHHALTRSRGGLVLDEVGESYHLIALCSRCHRQADGADAYDGGLLLDGYVGISNGAVRYYGTDTYLRSKYGGSPEPSE